MAYFNYKGHRCFYNEIGNGRPLLLLHGNTAASKMFDGVISLFSDKYKVVLIDFLGHGRSDRLDEFPTDLWFDEAMQVIELIKERKYEHASLIGTSGGALVAINAALEAPELIENVIADSFEGEVPLKAFTENVIEEREASKHDKNAIMFYQWMQGEDWEGVVDNDTKAIYDHSRTIGRFFHKPLEGFLPNILMTGSKEDEFISCIDKCFFEKTYDNMLTKIEHGSKYLFDKGSHPAMLSNSEKFSEIAKQFLEGVR